MTSEKQIETELQRGRKLLSPKRVGKELAETVADPTPEAIGALAGIGLTLDDPAVQGNLYVFGSWDKSERAVKKLKSSVPPDHYQVAGMNGVLVFFARARSDGEGTNPRYLLNNMLSAFSGNE
ncbi:MAG: hypothetical protein UZ15_CFX003002468 [Chloroflexi bacterium OLB15]|nr:MAG: hypothetical protein UZ15_CFX003002468 [Chloroflexi bacterium OLB15]